MGFDRMWYASNVLAIIDIERNGWSNKNEWFIGQIEPMVPSLLNLYVNERKEMEKGLEFCIQKM